LNTLDSTLSHSIIKNDRTRRVVARANEWLEEVLGQSASVIKASWDVAFDEMGREWIILRLSDFTHPNGLEARLRPEELADRTRAELRFYHLFGDLLQAQNKRMLHELTGSTAHGE
jgi:hypothetical protein